MKIALLAKAHNRYTGYVQRILQENDDVGLFSGKVSLDELNEYDLGISWFYPFILKREQIDAVRLGIINHHIGLLPWGRGAAPNVWAIANDEPAGVTMHWIDAGVDTGPIIFQEKVEKLITDTSEDLYNRLCAAMFQLFEKRWPTIRVNLANGTYLPGIEQREAYLEYEPPTHKMKDLEELDDLEKVYGRSFMRRVVGTLRARTFTGHEAAYIRDDQGRKVYVRVSLSYE